jgi:hypothetical protein
LTDRIGFRNFLRLMLLNMLLILRLAGSIRKSRIRFEYKPVE